MIKRIQNLFNLLLIIGVATLAIFVVYKLAKLGISAYSDLDKSVQATAFTAIALVLVAIVTYFANKTIETKKSVEQTIRPKKLELYQGFFDFLLRVLGNEKVITKPTEKEMMEFFIVSNPQLIAFASNSAIEKWGKLRLSMASEDGVKNLFLLEDLLKEMRKDLGHSATGFHKGDILRLFINDVDDYIKK